MIDTLALPTLILRIKSSDEHSSRQCNPGQRAYVTQPERPWIPLNCNSNCNPQPYVGLDCLPAKRMPTSPDVHLPRSGG